MISYLLAFFLGLGISWGPLSFLSIPIKSIGSILVSYTQLCTNYIIHNLLNVPHTSDLFFYLIPIISVSLPSFVALGLVFMAKTVSALKKTISILGIVLASFSFFFLSWTEALILVFISIVLAILINFVVGNLLIIPLVAFATTFAINIALEVFNDENPYIKSTVALFHQAQPSVDTMIWKYALTFAALAPLLGILGIVLSPTKKTP